MAHFIANGEQVWLVVTITEPCARVIRAGATIALVLACCLHVQTLTRVWLSGFTSETHVVNLRLAGLDAVFLAAALKLLVEEFMEGIAHAPAVRRLEHTVQGAAFTSQSTCGRLRRGRARAAGRLPYLAVEGVGLAQQAGIQTGLLLQPIECSRWTCLFCTSASRTVEAFGTRIAIVFFHRLRSCRRRAPKTHKASRALKASGGCSSIRVCTGRAFETRCLKSLARIVAASSFRSYDSPGPSRTHKRISTASRAVGQLFALNRYHCCVYRAVEASGARSFCQGASRAECTCATEDWRLGSDRAEAPSRALQRGDGFVTAVKAGWARRAVCLCSRSRLTAERAPAAWHRSQASATWAGVAGGTRVCRQIPQACGIAHEARGASCTVLQIPRRLNRVEGPNWARNTGTVHWAVEAYGARHRHWVTRCAAESLRT